MINRIDTINKELEDLGFNIDGNIYTLEKTYTQNIIINGRKMVQEHKQIFTMEYIGDGCELDEDHNEIEDSTFCEFDIKDENNCSVTVICVTCANDFRHFLNIF